MKTSTKIVAGIIVLLVIVGVVWVSRDSTPVSSGPVKVGAILPLTGPSAIWGENIRNGMELARKELMTEGRTFEFIYEDSAGDPAKGVTAFQKLQAVDRVPIVFSAFSRVSVPLIPLADQARVPLIMTAVAAGGVTEKSEYAFRFFPDDRIHAETHFASLEENQIHSLAVIYSNDEYGVSVEKDIKSKAAETAITVVASEKFDPGTTDFRTQLSRIKAQTPGAILMVVTAPGEVATIVKQARELGISAALYESSFLLSVASVRQGLGVAAEGVHTLALPFTLSQAGDKFKVAYKKEFGAEPFFAAGFGYDLVMMMDQALQKDPTPARLAKNITQLRDYHGVLGPITINKNREINPAAVSVVIRDGQLVQE